MKKLILSSLILFSLFAKAQTGYTNTSNLRGRLTDTTTLAFPSGYGFFYYNNPKGQWWYSEDGVTKHRAFPGLFTSTARGLVPGSGGGTTNFLRADGTWAPPASGITGSGTTNQLTYWTGSSSIGSLSTSTYPSLTELSYVKGLTSAAQTQIDGKQPLDSDLTSWAGVTRASGFDTWAATPSSANLRALLSDETGTGLAYFQGGDIGTPSAGVATNLTGTASGLNAGTAATLTTARNIQGVSFDGSTNIDIINGTGFVKASGTTLSYDNSTYLTTSSAASTYQPLNINLTTIAGLTATTDNFIVSFSSAWASRTPSQVKTTLNLNNVENTALSTWAGSTNITTLGTISTGTWNGSVIGSSYGGAGSVNGILKANGSGVVSAAVDGVDYLTSATVGAWLLPSGGTLTGPNTITANTSGWLIYNGTWSSSSVVSHIQISPSITNSAASNNSINALTINPSITVSNAGSTLTGAALFVNPNFSLSSNNIGYSLRVKSDLVYSSGVASSRYLVSVEDSGTNQFFKIDGTGATTFESPVTTNGVNTFALRINGQFVLRMQNGSGLIIGGTTTQTISSNGSTFNQSALTSGTPSSLSIVSGSHINLTASSEITDINFNNNRAVQRATGAVTTDRIVRLQPRTNSFVGASTITTAINVNVGGAPVAGTNASQTTAIALNVDSNNVGSGTTTAYGMYSNAPSGATNNYALGTNGASILTGAANATTLVVQEDGGTKYIEALESGGVKQLGFFGVTPVAQQSVNTILVNNVTSGGTTSTIADFTDLSTYSNDAATIRNNFYRLAEKVLKLETALRNYGLSID